MQPGRISVERSLPIDGALLGDVLLRLRRDSPAANLRWTLGERGSAEIEVCFIVEHGRWTSNARLWNSTGMAVTGGTVRLEPNSDDEVAMRLDCRAPEMAELARAALDEFAEELLWHATRAGLTPRG
jgi:hypothetical protein